MFLDRLKHWSCAPSAENAKSGQVLVRTELVDWLGAASN
jgi:hypothetical protein